MNEWIEVGDYSVHVMGLEPGVQVAIYLKGKETEPPLAFASVDSNGADAGTNE